MNVAALYAALEHHQDSLRTLEMGNYDAIDVGRFETFDTLHRFKSLRSLYINDALLIGNQAWDPDNLVLPTFLYELGSVRLRT